MTFFDPKTHWNPPLNALRHEVMSSTMSTLPHHTFHGLLGIKSPIDYNPTPHIINDADDESPEKRMGWSNLSLVTGFYPSKNPSGLVLM